ncbi:MAG: FliA/WhiG family RNA polymerase sigma factor [Planctomycetes bacterium]|nr:FliA/WhiG family RNA polymerase sigma factor [Planctomycetota bacterium]
MSENELDGLNVRDRLILEHIPLLRHIVGRMSIPPTLLREDVEGFGMLGLIAAADSWEEERGLKFSTYAFPKIRGAILDELRRMDFLPRGRRERLRALEQAVAALEQRNGVIPAIEEIAAELGASLDEVDEILQSARSVVESSLDVETASGSIGSLVADPKSDDPVGSAQWSEMKGLLIAAIQGLPEPDRTVITLYYGEGLLLRDISEVMGVTESRVSQIHSRALYRLNRELGARSEVGGG